ncbi:conserved hypothetical protein [Talaromyces stipitatus ATCC 10500]|nr:uncharacterized protein TSTA_060870 [Talaromyces stipitatus ATCC 10500]EED22596.1 conserved hypothetical protein [Talaromyces stipitatus ATCC 10500]
MGSVRFGSGILVARLDDGSWSAPSAIVVGGVGFGGQVGVEFTNFIFVLPRKSSVRTFAQLGSLTLTTNISLALGPMGRCGEVGLGASLHGLGALWAMSKTNGFFGGFSVELATFIENGSSNQKLYQKKLTAAQLLNGEIKPPDDAKMLMQCLSHKAFYSRRHRVPDPELPSDPSTATALELTSGAENQLPVELSTRGALPVGLPSESLSSPLEGRETSAREA